jgi:hypothetical protein
MQMYYLIYKSNPAAPAAPPDEFSIFLCFFGAFFLQRTRTARTSLGICIYMHGTGPQCAGTINERAPREHPKKNWVANHVVLTPYPHYGSAFWLKMY